MVEAQFFYASLRNIFYFLHEDDYKYSMVDIIENDLTKGKVESFFKLHDATVETEDDSQTETFTYPVSK